MTTKDTGYAPESWAFDDEVTRVFDDMLDRSIPQHRVIRAAIMSILADRIGAESGVLYDLGSSRGEMIASLLRGNPNLEYHAMEVSPPMLDAMRERFARESSVYVHDADLREGVQTYGGLATAITSMLTIMFTPIELRSRIVRSIYDALEPGGIFIMVEKILGDDEAIDSILVEQYYNFKRESGYTDDEIERKRLSLQGVLVPVTAKWNTELLTTAGFSHVETFWRWMNFSGWVAIK
jgi:tRNA (cmo5U34)-methyltransferase|tara:strand:- start:788 stop:1498 length:711 start_codon:yes stop_codon:yes gene_type:complete